MESQKFYYNFYRFYNIPFILIKYIIMMNKRQKKYEIVDIFGKFLNFSRK